MYPTVTLKTGKEANARHRHPWIFSGAIAKSDDDLEPGDLVRVTDGRGEALGVGTFSNRSSIAVRLLDFRETEINAAWFAARFRAADDRRRLLGFGPGTDTDGYRVVFGEADGVPGLVVDRYRDILVVQVSTVGMNRLREEFTAALREVFAPRAVYERSDLPSRRDEGLQDASGPVLGEVEGPVEFGERGLKFLADVTGGQKTGFFLDQKDLRAEVRRLAHGRRVLNLFSYTGACSVAALAGGAESVHNVDLSGAALAFVARQVELNGLDASAVTVEEADVFQWLSAERAEKYDMVIVDPPALIKSAKDTEQGKKAYHFLNRAALRLVAPGGVIVTSSCSHFLSEEDFAFILRRASVQGGVVLAPLTSVRQAVDHPVSVYFPESAYLKSFVARVERE